MFYGSSYWLITIRGEVKATKGKTTDFRLPELGISKTAFTALPLLRVLIEIKALSPFYLHFAYQLPSMAKVSE